MGRKINRSSWGFETQVNDRGNVTGRIMEDPDHPIEFPITEEDAKRILYLFEMKRVKDKNIQWGERDARKDLEYCKEGEGLLHEVVLPYWICTAVGLQERLGYTDELIKMEEDENRKLRNEAEVQRIRAEAAERKSEQLSTSLEMITDSFQQFKKSVSLLETQIDGFVNMYPDQKG